MRSPGPTFDLRGALTEELRAAASELDDALLRPKAVHRCRVRIKRARALARVGRACAPGLSEVFNDSARSVMHALARTRELAALAQAAEEASKTVRKREAQALQAVAAALEAERAASGPLDTDAIRAGLRDLLALAQVWPEASARQVRRGAVRIVRRARKAQREALSASEVTQRHEWRKREKDRLYAASLLGGAWPRPRRRKLGEKLGDRLGDERDTQLLIARLEIEPEIAGGAEACKRARRALRRRERKLATRADAIGAKLHRDNA